MGPIETRNEVLQLSGTIKPLTKSIFSRQKSLKVEAELETEKDN